MLYVIFIPFLTSLHPSVIINKNKNHKGEEPFGISINNNKEETSNDDDKGTQQRQQREATTTTKGRNDEGKLSSLSSVRSCRAWLICLKIRLIPSSFPALAMLSKKKTMTLISFRDQLLIRIIITGSHRNNNKRYNLKLANTHRLLIGRISSFIDWKTRFSIDSAQTNLLKQAKTEITIVCSVFKENHSSSGNSPSFDELATKIYGLEGRLFQLF